MKDKIKHIINEEIIKELSKRHIHENERLDEMARVGFLGNNYDVIVLGNNYDVIVWTDDPGFIPHVHIRDTSTRGQEFDTCVMLETNKYFLHNGYIDKMNSRMCKAFDDFMRQPSRNVHYRNNYEHAVNLWNDNNSEAYIQIKEDEEGNIIIPDYTHIFE